MTPSPTPSIPRLSIRGVSKSFEAVRALRDVSFDLAPGEVHALVGENGAGKSTLVGIITGLRQSDTGTILLDGKPVSFKNPLDARAAGVAAVYQDPNLFPHLSVAENILTGQYPMRGPFVDSAAMRTGATKLLEKVGYPLDVDRLVASLTVAEAQFVEIARALSSDLRLLILDEPTSALTPSEASKLYEVVQRLKDEGTTVVWISHRMEEIRRLSDTITVLRDGGHVITAPCAELEDDEMIRLMVGRSVVLETVKREEPLGPVRLSVRGLSAPGMFQDISFDIREGEIVGVAGLVGSGRSEIARAIFGLNSKLTGTVEVHGSAIRPKSPGQMAENGVVYLPEDRDTEGLISTMSVKDNIALTSIKALSTFGFMRPSLESERAEKQRIDLSIKGGINDLVSSLSGGNRQKVAIARWLANNPTVLLLDEPTHGIDVGTKADVHSIMRDLARKERMAILMISSDLPEVLAVSDRVLVISRGQLAADIDIADATQEKILAAATTTVSQEKSA
jgi:rhamnose transport system ATP-binding protein